MRIVTSFYVLMRLAKDLGIAEQGGDSEKIEAAKKAHDDYRDLCLASDEMMTHYTHGDLYA